MKKDILKRPESSIQFDAIYKEHHDPRTREQKKIIENRKKRVENNKQDNGL